MNWFRIFSRSGDKGPQRRF